MKAVLFERFGELPKIAEVPAPSPSRDGVVIEVKATGLCRSDWHGWMGHDTCIELPHVPGHEFAGVVEAVGKDVRNFKVGDRVTAPFIGACGGCFECHSGNQQVCENQFQPGFTQWGSFAQYVGFGSADLNLVPLPESISFEEAASLGCRFATSFRAVVDQGKLSAGQWLAVHGCGGVGLSAIMIANAIGARIVAVDIDDAKLKLARELGAHHTIDARNEPDTPSAIKDLTGGGAAVSIDALGHPAICVNSVRSLRRRGKHIQVGLLLGDDAAPKIPMDIVVAHELKLLGSHGMQAHRYDAMLSLVQSGGIDLGQLIGNRIDLAAGAKALGEMDRFQGVGATLITRFD